MPKPILARLFALLMVLTLVMSPVAYAQDGDLNLLEVLQGREDATTLVTALELVNLSDALTAEGPLTVFAPTDDAFARYQGAVDVLLNDLDLVTRTIQYHVVEGAYTAETLSGMDGETLITLEGTELTVSVADDVVSVNEIPVIEADVTASNGVIHMIDGLLILPGVEVPPPSETVPPLPDLPATTEGQPETVSVPGTFNALVGCGGDWSPDCDAIQMAFDEETSLWIASFDLPAGSYEFKIAIERAWTENYGLGGVQDGPNIPLELEADSTVTFTYDHATHEIIATSGPIEAQPLPEGQPNNVSVPGTFNAFVGCSGDWAPDCDAIQMSFDFDTNLWVASFDLPANSYEFKIAIDKAWTENYGLNGEAGGANIPLVLEVDSTVVFSYNHETHDITFEATPTDEPIQAPATPEPTEEPAQEPVEGQPESVSVPGSFNAAVGCGGDWAPDCAEIQMTYEADNDWWVASFDIPAGSYEYKVAINGTWDENYGLNAESYGPNIPLVLEEDTTVTFHYSHVTHWIADDVNTIVANVPGNYQDEIGCPEWAPSCFRSWLQDPDGDGVYTFATAEIPAGNYEAKVALNGSWALNYGADGAKDGANIPFIVPEDGSYVVFSFDTSNNIMTITADGEVPLPPAGDITLFKAHWVSRDTIAWTVGGDATSIYRLYYAADGALDFSVDTGVTGGEAIDLVYDENGLSEEILAKFPHLAGATALHLPEDMLEQVPDLLKGDLVAYAESAEGELLGATRLQIPGVIDDLYTYGGTLGVTFSDGVPSLSVWAPTARTVRLHLFDDADPASEATIIDMAHDAVTGVWSVTGEADWAWKFYVYEVTVFVPREAEVLTNLVTDPYAVSLSLNSQRSQIVDFNDPALTPEGWDSYTKPTLERPEDVVVYELHVRDFSVNDMSVPEEYRGTFMAFTLNDSNGMTHLRNLARAGLTHLHLLPFFDIATIDENKSNWESPTFEELSAFAADSDEQQALLNPVRDLDGFNWGYDPYHYNVPEGSYSTDPNGPQRIIEARQMVMSLNQNGLRVVMDVVYNHTNSAGQAERSVLDRIVPGYYHRLDANGNVTTSTCCQNTATEHNMMRKLMVDSVVMWATAYKIDGFRFDLMGHHMLTDMVEVRDALDALTVEANGVDGSSIYVYGEGWNFGEVQDNARGINATQLNIGGTGIGAFNDRLRDAVRGGNPFGGWQNQGFATGLYYDPNGITEGTEAEQLERLLLFADQIRVGLAGNLRDYTFMNAAGEMVTGADVSYNGSPTGYTLDPQENIVYISAHDNEAWFDALQYKVPTETSLEDRVRVANMGMSIVLLSQGVPFFQAGDDMLRSKSFDRNSYNSGDWFNRLDFTYESNNFGVGLPPSGDNQSNYPIMLPLLQQEGITPTRENIVNAVNHFQEMLRIRKSSALFRLETAEDIQARVAFHNTGPDQLPGVIVMSLADDGELANLDPNLSMIVVVFNATDEPITFTEDALAGTPFVLHFFQQFSQDVVVRDSAYDSATGTFSVPARTTAVFVSPQR